MPDTNLVRQLENAATNVRDAAADLSVAAQQAVTAAATIESDADVWKWFGAGLITAVVLAIVVLIIVLNA